MALLDDIARALKAHTPAKGGGDHALNPGMDAGTNLRAAAVLILLIPREDGLTVLFTERTTTLPSHAGQVSFPGGSIDPEDADDIAAALREAQEEIGLDPAKARVLGVLDEYITRTGFSVRPVVAVLEQDHEWQPSAHEVAEIFEVPLDYILSDGALEKRTVMFEEKERHFFAIDWDGFHIWGATAGMLRQFADVIRPHLGGAPSSAPEDGGLDETPKDAEKSSDKKGPPPANKP